MHEVVRPSPGRELVEEQELSVEELGVERVRVREGGNESRRGGGGGGERLRVLGRR